MKTVPIMHLALNTKELQFYSLDLEDFFEGESTVIDDILTETDKFWYFIAIKFKDRISEVFVTRKSEYALDFIEPYIKFEFESIEKISIFETFDLKYALDAQHEIYESEKYATNNQR